MRAKGMKIKTREKKYQLAKGDCKPKELNHGEDE